MQPLACSVCRIWVVEKPRQTISPKRLIHLIVKSFLGKNGRTEIDFECSAMSRQKAKEVARTAGVCKPLSPRIFRPFCAYLYDSKNSNCQISLARAILPSFSWGSASFQMKRSDISRLDLADLAQTDCCGQPCRSDWDSSLLNWNVFSNG